ncbi:unnamed protein product, partial [Anisakis simplex]|uniref:U-box domain-containing protein 9-like n=1 Tax=Anisakis simplex TaxID=6269 RepID=A0A0M3JKZ6_ANISI
MKHLQIVSVSAKNKECVSDIASISQLSLIFALIIQQPKAIPMVLESLLSLSSNGRVVKETLEYGGLLYILHILCEANQADSGEDRIRAAELLAKLQTD